MKKVCVMGAGTMGLDVAQVFATKGFEVTVRDISDEILDAAKAKLIKEADQGSQRGYPGQYVLHYRSEGSGRYGPDRRGHSGAHGY